MESAQETQNTVVKLTILYSVELEIQRAQSAVKKIPWYVANGYGESFAKLPEGITKASNDEAIAKAVRSEYSEDEYVKFVANLQKEWTDIPSGFEKMKEEPTLHLESEYEVMLTKYGSGGSYDLEKNRVIIRINRNLQEGIVPVVVHEITHMTIQYLIDQYKVRQWHKERLVDLLLEQYFPGLKKQQNIREDVSMVDQAFERFFPNMKGVVKSVGEYYGKTTGE